MVSSAPGILIVTLEAITGRSLWCRASARSLCPQASTAPARGVFEESGFGMVRIQAQVTLVIPRLLWSLWASWAFRQRFQSTQALQSVHNPATRAAASR